MNIDKLLDELIVMLDNNSDIKRIVELKNNIDDDIRKLIDNYREFPTVENKMKLYENKVFNEYIKCESNVNYLIMAINSKFRKGKVCEGNKW